MNLDALLPLGPNSLNTDFFSYIIAAETRKKGNNKATSISYIRSSAEDSPQPERHMFENVSQDRKTQSWLFGLPGVTLVFKLTANE